MGSKRLISGLCVVSAAVIAACFGATPYVSSTSQEILLSSSTSYNFGNVNVGQTATTTMPFIISPQSSADDDTITSITENCGYFDVILNPDPAQVGGYRIWCDGGIGTNNPPSSFASGTGGGSGMCTMPNSYAFDATFHPSGGGAASCTVNVNYMPTGGGSGQTIAITLQGSGVAPTFALTSSPPHNSTISFGDIPVGQTSSGSTVTITNTGTGPLSVNTLVQGTNANWFTVTPLGGATLIGQSLPTTGSNATFDVKCSPMAQAMAMSTTLRFQSAAPEVVLNLSCRGVAPSMISANPSPAAFASTLVGRAPADLPITLTYNGTAVNLVVTLTQANGLPANELTFTASGNPNNQSISTGNPRTATLHYAGTVEHPSGSLGTLSVSYVGNPGQPLLVAINGEALTGSLDVSPGTEIDFGPVCVSVRKDVPVSLYATASGKINVTSVTPPNAPFSATNTSGQLQANHANALMFTASVMPTAAGDLTDKVIVRTNMPTTPDREITLKAKALPAGVTPTPGQVHFGPAHISTPSTKEVIVSNCGTTPITFTSARIEGASANEFAVSELPTSPIGQTSDTRFTVVMIPQTNGPKVAQLILEYEGGMLAIDLDGNGFGGDLGGDDEMETYYTCNAGSSGVALGAALALGLVFVRRRRRA